ncbi:hypothetical protein HMPREF0576_0731 [Mobiluncus holmesii ATCC 35242]|uniref:Uncharacterized protein n=1 Tax=Mobiluncus holmesii ATCC 35242 TaxID=887899 RepID=E6M326_9ACTO|nr:hypothetical protein HMPREF0576_0731 [Mobiluncus holmesii ATCC 35242]STY88666.1 Uncharacterised protein [Mobiluncus holmesii]
MDIFGIRPHVPPPDYLMVNSTQINSAGNEITQNELAHALFKLGKADEVKRLNLKYSK